jgi:Amt family ammonium transporter
VSIPLFSFFLLKPFAYIKCRIVGFLFIVGWDTVWTSLILCFIKYVLRVPLRMSEATLLAGDSAIHGEEAYVLGPCEAHEHMMAGEYVKRSDVEAGGLTLGRDPLEHEQSSGTANGKGKDGVVDSDIKAD